MIRRFVLNYVFEKDTKYGNGDRIGEGGFPTNLYMMSRKLTGNTAMDEKAEPHIGMARGIQKGQDAITNQVCMVTRW